MNVLGLDIGGTKCAALIGTTDGDVIARHEWSSDARRGPDAMIDDLCDAGRALLAEHPDTTAVGVSIGGPLDVTRGIVKSPPNLPGWDNVALKQILSDRLRLPVRVEHDAAACAMAEFLWGAARSMSRVAYLTCGTGFGFGFVVNGQTYHGAAGQTCEIGHIRYRSEGPEAFGKIGSFEAFGAGASLGKLAAWAFPQRWAVAPTGEELSRLADSGDAAARRVLHLNATAVGDACALVADLLCPDVILLGSLSRYLGEDWLQTVWRAFDDEVGATSPRRCSVLRAGLGSRLQDCSALAAAATAGLHI